MIGPVSGSLLSVVVPVYNEQERLGELHRRLTGALRGLPVRGELIYVDDGSVDGSADTIAGFLGDPEFAVVLIQLSRNFGMELAMSAGIDEARGDHVVLMHADLQDPPELIGEMLERAGDGADVVYARRIGRDESALKRLLATGFYAMMSRIARVPYQGQAGDFRLMSRRVVDVLKTMPERRRFVRGMVAWLGFRQEPIEYRRAGRQSGRGATYPQLFRLAFEALAAFSDVPLKIATFVGMAIAAVSAIGAAVIIVAGAVGVFSAAGWVWVLAAVLFFSGLQLITVGILGRYVARVHDEALHRPLYVVDRVRGR